MVPPLPETTRRVWGRAHRSEPAPRSAPPRWLLALLGLAVILPGLANAQDFMEPGFLAETVVSLQPFKPVGMTWSHDGTLFIWQKDGLVLVYRGGVLQPEPFIDL